ncbi:hypothetical protein KDE13_05025 [Campylobacter sp. faydin G-140]|uniref:hypothetical protein n=1 Tax=Campylobacter anatolicus TaxID=2829105 RepID=UPI001BA1618B|nr:hypothetical protein [Campylobacter anatolicus]MBR8465720.1 hypothetical protein [Campylobacter anatolicus]
MILIRKILLILTAFLALANADSFDKKATTERAFYEQILSELKTKQIPQFIEGIASLNLPRRIDEITTISSLDANGLNINAIFSLNDIKTRQISKFNSKQLEALKSEFKSNGKKFLCKESVSIALLNRGIVLFGSYHLDGRHLFDIKMDKSSCE